MFRRYGASLPSSLTVSLPSALVCSTRPRVSVWGTGDPALMFSGFSWKPAYRRSRPAAGAGRTLALRLGRRTCLPSSAPSRFNPLFRQGAAVSLLRRRVTRQVSNGMLTVSTIAIARRLMLRTRLTLDRLALSRKPWPFGGGASHPPCRYSCLHLLFHALQTGSRRAFHAACNAPLPALARPTASAAGFIPDYYPRPDPRLVSCYALFERMAASKPTS